MVIVDNGTELDVLGREGGACLVRQNAHPRRRPYLHPVIAPDGVGELTENAPPHHPWQHGIYVGLNEVNGIGFWTEGLLPERAHTDGTFEISEATALGSDDTSASWRVVTRYLDPAGSALIEEGQTWTLTDHGDAYALDLSWSLTGVVDVTFGHYRYGGPFIRVPFRDEAGGAVRTSEGATTMDEADQERARWVSISIPLADRASEAEPRVSVTVMDHPANPGFPVPWRVDAQLGVAPSRCILGEWRLAAGETAMHLHRYLVTVGVPGADRIEADYAAFTQKGTTP
jgi:hypothetical protein